MSDIPNNNAIVMFLHCGLCLMEIPDGVAPREWARHEVGWTKQGIQVWCRRHEANVLHMDFEGHKHPANARMKKEKEA